MNFDIEAWQPIAVALISAIVPALISGVMARRASQKATRASKKAEVVSGEVETVAKRVDVHDRKLNGELDDMRADVKRLTQWMTNEDRRPPGPPKRPDG